MVRFRHMAKRVKTRTAYTTFLTSLKPRSLVLLRQHFATMTNTITGESNEVLESLTTLPKTVEDIREFHDYRDAFGKELALLKITKEDDAAVVIAMNILEEALEPKITTIIENSLPAETSAKLTGRKSGADFVVQVYLEFKKLDLIRKAIHQHGTVKQKGYVYYTPAFRESLKAIPVYPDDAKLDWAEGILSNDFVYYLDEKLCDISVIELDGLWYFDIVHGGAGEQGELINEKSEREDYALQRPEYDTMVFNPRTGDLMMHLQNKRNRIASCYLHVLGQVIFGVEDYWSKSERFTTSPFTKPVEYIRNKVLQLGSLRDKNPKLLRVGLYGINLVRTYAPTAEVGRVRKSTKKFRDSYCLTTGRAPEEKLVEEGDVLDSVDLLFEFASPENDVTPYHLTIKADQITPKGNSVLVGQQEWLLEVGISLLGETLEERRERYAKNPKLKEAVPKKIGREKNRPLLLERAMSSHKRIPKTK